MRFRSDVASGRQVIEQQLLILARESRANAHVHDYRSRDSRRDGHGRRMAAYAISVEDVFSAWLRRLSLGSGRGLRVITALSSGLRGDCNRGGDREDCHEARCH